MEQMSAKVVVCAALMAALGVVAGAGEAAAFCGFYVSGADSKLKNDATQVVMMREGTMTVLSMQNTYEGPPQDFAMVVPVPEVLQEDRVKVLPQDVFDRVDQLAAPRLVEYWERDPCEVRYKNEVMSMSAPRRRMSKKSKRASGGKDLGVTIEAQFEVGEYDVVILSAKESSGLETWLKQNKYNIPDGAGPTLKSYIQQGMYFFVAKVNIKKVKKDAAGRTLLSPLRFHYNTPSFSLPVRLGMLNADGKQDLIVHILARGQRYEVANAPNVTIPTNIIVREDVRSRFPEFYATLFDRVTEENPGAVVTEYAWDASTCDPCPVPGLRYKDFLTLGADVAQPDGDGAEATPGPPSIRTKRRRSGRPFRRRPPRRRWGGGWVLTRLHTRYDDKSLKDDLVFKKAEAILGGRGTPQGIEAKISEQVAKTGGGYNNFQGRYMILHPWEGKIACENPSRGDWTGPPRGAGSRSPATAGRQTAFAPRGKAKLASFVAPGVSVPAFKNVVGEGEPAVIKPAGAGTTSGTTGGTTSGTTAGAATTAGQKASAGKCASTAPSTPAPMSLMLFGMVAVGLLGRSRSRRS